MLRKYCIIGGIKMLRELKGTFILIIVWTCIFIINKNIKLMDILSSKGINNINSEYYRFITGALLHVNILHLLSNVCAMFWIGYFLEHTIGSVKMILFIFCATFIANFIFSLVYKDATSVIGGSAYVFTIIGLIIVLQMFKCDFPRFHLGTWYGNWILIYGIVSNLPVMSFINSNTVVMHVIALVTGVALGGLCLFIGVL